MNIARVTKSLVTAIEQGKLDSYVSDVGPTNLSSCQGLVASLLKEPSIKDANYWWGDSRMWEEISYRRLYITTQDDVRHTLVFNKVPSWCTRLESVKREGRRPTANEILYWGVRISIDLGIVAVVVCLIRVLSYLIGKA